MSVLSDVREIVTSRDLLLNFTRRELKGKYKRTALGWTWSLINPLATMAIFTVVFATFLRVEPTVGANGLKNYALFLLCALLPWNFMSGTVTAGLSSLVNNANLIQKTYFPRQLLVLSSMMAMFVSFTIEMAVLCVVLAIFGASPIAWLVPVFVLMVLLALFSLGLGLVLAVANVHFRDSAHFVSIALQIAFYATPVIYPIILVQNIDPSSLVARLHLDDLYDLNPMVGFVESFRDLLYEHRFPPATTILYMTAVTAASLLVGLVVFGRAQSRLAEEL